MVTLLIFGALAAIIIALGVVLSRRSGSTKFDATSDAHRDAGRPPESFRIPPTSGGGTGFP